MVRSENFPCWRAPKRDACSKPRRCGDCETDSPRFCSSLFFGVRFSTELWFSMRLICGSSPLPRRRRLLVLLCICARTCVEFLLFFGSIRELFWRWPTLSSGAFYPPNRHLLPHHLDWIIQANALRRTSLFASTRRTPYSPFSTFARFCSFPPFLFSQLTAFIFGYGISFPPCSRRPAFWSWVFFYFF